MQLKKDKPVRAALVAATCTLLGQQAAADPGDWSFDAATLFYTEMDRVSAIEPVFEAKREFEDDAWLNMKLVVDALTGASANGAMPSSMPQTFTRASGEGGYTVAPGETPLDDTFRDTRVAFSSSWTQWLSPNWKLTGGGNVSTEYDFQSLAGNLLLSRDFNQRNTTLSFGASFEADSMDPVGGVPTPLAEMPSSFDDDDDDENDDFGDDDFDDDDIATRAGSESKTVADLLVGVTQVLNRNALLQLNYTYSQSDGYLTDPYKLVSVIEAQDVTTLGGPLYHLYENRPDTRSKHGLYAGTKWYFGGDILNASYRYMTDDWGIDSHTIDLRYRFDIGNDSHLEPHLRYYTQSAADFYQRALLSNAAVPQYVSADYRLGELTGTTLGLQYGTRMGEGEFRVRAEYFVQSGSVEDSVNIGIQQQYDLFPDVEAAIVQFSYSFGF